MTQSKVVGKGLSQRCIEEMPATKEALLEKARAINKSLELDNLICTIEARVKPMYDAFIAKGCPGQSDPRCCGSWRVSQACWGAQPLEGVDQAWYANRALIKIKDIRTCMKAKKYQVAVVKAFQLGALMQEAKLKYNFDTSFITGEGVLHGMRKGREAQNAYGHDEKIIQMIKQNYSRQLIINETGMSKSGVSKAIKRLNLK